MHQTGVLPCRKMALAFEAAEETVNFCSPLIHHHAPDRLPLRYQVERVVDLVERHRVRDEIVDGDLAPPIPVDDFGPVGAAAR
jgi:hypothetical protein